MRQPSAKMCRLRDVAKILVTEKPAMSLDGGFADEEGACALVRTSHLVQIALLVLVVLEAAVHASLRHPRRGRPWRVHEPRLVSGDAQPTLARPRGPEVESLGPFSRFPGFSLAGRRDGGDPATGPTIADVRGSFAMSAVSAFVVMCKLVLPQKNAL